MPKPNPDTFWYLQQEPEYDPSNYGYCDHCGTYTQLINYNETCWLCQECVEKIEEE